MSEKIILLHNLLAIDTLSVNDIALPAYSQASIQYLIAAPALDTNIFDITITIWDQHGNIIDTTTDYRDVVSGPDTPIFVRKHVALPDGVESVSIDFSCGDNMVAVSVIAELWQ